MISVVINTYNAEKHLARVLEAVKGFDEVLVCDMQSTDSTLAIARQYGCKVASFPRGTYNIVEPARQYAIDQASGDWILVVDADEIVPTALRDYLYSVTAQSNCPDGLYIPRKNYFMGRFMRCHYPDYILRFFRKAKTTWPPIIHAQPSVDGHVARIPQRRHDLAFDHLANDTVYERIAKTNTYTDNELAKKAHKHYGPLAFIYRPLHRFLKAYILKGGFRDGIPGFIKASLEGYYQFVMLAKLYEKHLPAGSIQH